MSRARAAFDNYFLPPFFVRIAHASIGKDFGVSKEQLNLIGYAKEFVKAFLALFCP
jgi:hypothetical protein